VRTTTGCAPEIPCASGVITHRDGHQQISQTIVTAHQTRATMDRMMTRIPENLDALLNRAAAAAALTEAGYPVAKATLATRATRGGGPAYRLFGRKPLYRWGDLLAWAQNSCTEPRRNTSEHRSSVAA
jgi:hypothetical protein